MNKLVRFYNKNRRIIWSVIIIIVILIIFKKMLNIEMQKNNNSCNSSINSRIFNTTINTNNNNNYSIITEKEISQITGNKNEQIINSFIKYCNENNTTEAYNLLTEECKEELFQTEQEFIDNYYNRIFNTKKQHTINLWVNSLNSYTYKINLKTDSLSSGKINNDVIEDYYTIINTNGEYKLNINGYIGKEEINLSATNNGVTISIIEKQKYMEYEKYKIKADNNTENTIMLDNKQNTTTMYLMDSNELKYYAYIHEILDNELIINNNFSKEIEIKYSKSYKPNLKIENMIFNNIILNYNDYLKIENKNEYNNKTKIEIEM